jgi:Fe-S cluster assembly protein SufD
MTAAETLTAAWSPRGEGWTEARRREALASFARTGFPTPRHEDWKYTSLAGLQKATLDVDGNRGVAPIEVPNHGLSRIVFVDGRLDARLTHLNRDPRIRISGLAHGMEQVRERLFSLDDAADAPTALNEAWFEDGLYVEVPRGIALEEPLHVVSVSTGIVAHPRDVVVLGDGASATVLHQSIGPDGKSYLVNRASEVWLGADSRLDWTELVEEGSEGYQLASMRVRQDRGSTLSMRRFALGGALTRLTLSTDLGDGATADLSALSLAGPNQTHDLHTLVAHRSPHGTSRESLRGVVASGGRAVFTGKILVDKDAQKTDSAQSIRHILLGDDAIANGRPQLEIHADDVKCSHGVAIGRLDPEAMFFLRSRGLGEAEAKSLLTWAFATTVADQVPAKLRQFIDGPVQQHLTRITGGAR